MSIATNYDVAFWACIILANFRNGKGLVWFWVVCALAILVAKNF